MKKLLLIALLPFAAMGAVIGPDTVNAPVANAAAVQGQDQGQLQGQAQGQDQGQLQGQSQGNFNAVDVENDVRNTANSASLSNADSRSSSAALSGSVSGSFAGASQSQDATANNEGNSQSITFNAPDRVKSSGEIRVRSVPTAIAPNIYPTASCAMSASAGASTLGTGISFGGTKVNHECVMLETARVFSQLGYPSQGLDIACSTKVALDVFGSKESCIAGGVRLEAPGDAPSVVVVPGASGVTQEQVNETVEKAFKTAVSK